MSLSKYLRDKLRSRTKAKQKKQAVRAVLDAEQSEQAVVNIHRVDDKNVGDFYCAPYLYFDELQQHLDVYNFKSANTDNVAHWIETIASNALIVGGGGMLNRGSFAMQMKLFETLAERGKKIVIWGAGHNVKKSHSIPGRYNVNLDAFPLVGVRDYSMGQRWVPCASCLHTIFDQSFTVEQEVGVVLHKKTLKKKKVIAKVEDYPNTSNTTNLEDLISFIASSESIVTDSYHAMYWAMLLEKKVVVIPQSSKFFDFKYKPVFSSFDTFAQDLKQSQIYSGVLQECRDINKDFAQDAFALLGL